MDHDGARRLMAEAMEGRLSETDERELALHLVGCEDCKRVYEGLQHANPALTSIQLGEPSTDSLDAAVHRATTVLRGEADPGPMGLSDEAPGLPDELDSNTVRIDSGTSFHEPDIQPAGPLIATGPMQPPSGAVRPLSESHVRAIIEEPPVIDEPPVVDPPPTFEEPAHIEMPPAHEAGPDVSPLTVDLGPEIDEQPPTFESPVAPQPIVVPAQRSEIDTLLEADRARFEPLPYEDDPDDDDRMSPGPWLMAIAVTVVLAVLAGFLITRGGSLFGGGGDLPTADEVRSRVERAFTDMKSLKTNFDIQKLSLYRVGRDENSLRYSFSTGHWEGNINYDRSEGYKQDFTLNVGKEEVSRAQIVQRTDETRGLTGADTDQRFIVENNPPLGPPDGQLRSSLGLLEDSLGSVAALIADAEDLKVVRQTEREGRQLYEISFTVPATELTRADKIEAALDANRFFPVIVKRTITRENAQVLGPSSALTAANLDKAFGDKEEVITELVQLENLQYDEIVLPGDLLLEAPEGVEEQTSDAKFERVTRAELGSKIDYEPLLPRSLPGKFEEQLFATYTGEKQKWGPNGSFPGPESVFHTQYFDGRTTIVLSQRRMSAKFNITQSPLQRAGLPITIREIERDGETFFYGTSPEVAPHVYGFVGNTFVMASGYASQNELVRLVSSLAETPVDISAPLVSASPGASASPGSSAAPADSPSASASPAGTTSPLVTATP